MRILEEKSRNYKGKAYFKYRVNIPKGALQRAQVSPGDDVSVSAEPGMITLSKTTRASEFAGVRARMYKQALELFPDARKNDLACMRKYLNPQFGERILEIGAGSGFFSGEIADSLGESGRLIVSDPSLDKLAEVMALRCSNVDVIQYVQFGSKNVDLEKNKVDAVWSFGAMHHMWQKQKSLHNMMRILKPSGRIVICDVFQGSRLAQHFDTQVARFCETGHEVSFWSREYAESICNRAGFSKPKFIDVDMKWTFEKKKDIGAFLYLLHAMTGTTEKECLKGAETILGVKKTGAQYILHWPMTIMITKHQ